MPATDTTAAPANIWLWDMDIRCFDRFVCGSVRGMKTFKMDRGSIKIDLRRDRNRNSIFNF